MRLIDLDEQERKEKINEIITKKNKETKSVVFAIDISNTSDTENLKNLLTLLMSSVSNYNANYHLILFYDVIYKIKENFILEDIEDLLKDINAEKIIAKPNYDIIFNTINNNEVIHDKLFKCIVLTEGYGELNNKYDIDTLWITGNKEFYPCFGEILDLSKNDKQDNKEVTHECNCKKDKNHKCDCKKDKNHKCTCKKDK